ncbi:hypothetical protein QCA50_006596 [Cerrena zonata]|uniref:Protein kinase domain-containing protein n=1 Tax=Cerrena zonata TaxID=2478898 RepID=A0AAW0GK96_9APHY
MHTELYRDTEHNSAILTPFWADGRRRSRPNLSPLISAEKEHEYSLNATSLSDEVDKDRRSSQQLLAAEDVHIGPSSVPESSLTHFLFASPPFNPSYSQEDISQPDLALSPAAMFLSSFSPMTQSSSLPDDEGEVVSGYTLGPVVGHGAFSIIRRAFSAQGGTVAVKIVRRADINKQQNPDKAKQHLDHERQVWSSLNHEHILPLFSSSHTHYADFFVTLFCPAGSLFDILKRDGRPALLQDDAGMMFRQVVRGLRYLHEVAGIVHRDLKLENVLVDEMGICRIGDFGMARKIGSGDDDPSPPSSDHEQDDAAHDHHARHARLRHRATVSAKTKAERSRSRQGLSALPIHLSLKHHRSGPRHRNSSPLPSSSENPDVYPNPTFQPGSLPYAAPELLIPQNTSAPRPNPAQDIWALGIMLYALLTGRLPFADSFEPRLQMKILHGVYDVPEGIGRGAERVLQGCIERSVPNRWTIDMVDEVAWGVGWGADGDDAAVPSPVQSFARPSPLREERSTSASRSRSSRRSPSRGASAVRSTSRSASRSAGHPYHHPATNSLHPHSHSSHHHGLPRSHLPTFSALNDAILRSTSSSSTSSSSSFPTESVFDYDGGRRSERGRPRLPQLHQMSLQSNSRSTSPQDVVPPTPSDSLVDPEVDRIRGRGRKASPRHLRTSPADHPFLQRDLEATSPPLHTVDEYAPSQDARWLLSPEGTEGSGSLYRDLSHDSQMDDVRYEGDEERPKTRPGSMPPTPAPGFPWKLDHSPTPRSGNSSQVAATPIPVTGRQVPTRSRSLGYGLRQ